MTASFDPDEMARLRYGSKFIKYMPMEDSADMLN